jgi:hypothetical protein
MHYGPANLKGDSNMVSSTTASNNAQCFGDAAQATIRKGCSSCVSQQGTAQVEADASSESGQQLLVNMSATYKQS